MKLLCLSLLTLLLYSCSNDDKLSLGETIQAPQIERTKDFKLDDSTLAFLQIKSFKNLKIFADDENLLTKKLNYSKRHNLIDNSLIDLDMSDFIESLHTKEIIEFQDNHLNFDLPKENCEIEFELEFFKPQLMNDKIVLRDIDLDLIIELTSGEKISLPAIFKKRNIEIKNKSYYLVKSLKELDHISCDELIKKRGRLSVKLLSFMSRDNKDYFSRLQKKITGKDIFISLEEDHLNIKLNTNKTVSRDWTLITSSPNNLYINQTMLNANKRSRWKRFNLEIKRDREIDLFDAKDELSLKISGNLFIPTKKDDGGQYKPATMGERAIICHKTTYTSQIKSKEILKEAELKKLPISISWGQRERLIWELPGIKIENKDKIWFVKLPLNFTNDKSEKILNLNTFIKEHHFDLSPKYLTNPNLCEAYFDKKTKLSETVNESAIYLAEIYFR